MVEEVRAHVHQVVEINMVTARKQMPADLKVCLRNNVGLQRATLHTRAWKTISDGGPEEWILFYERGIDFRLPSSASSLAAPWQSNADVLLFSTEGQLANQDPGDEGDEFRSYGTMCGEDLLRLQKPMVGLACYAVRRRVLPRLIALLGKEKEGLVGVPFDESLTTYALARPFLLSKREVEFTDFHCNGFYRRWGWVTTKRAPLTPTRRVVTWQQQLACLKVHNYWQPARSLLEWVSDSPDLKVEEYEFAVWDELLVVAWHLRDSALATHALNQLIWRNHECEAGRQRLLRAQKRLLHNVRGMPTLQRRLLSTYAFVDRGVY